MIFFLHDILRHIEHCNLINTVNKSTYNTTNDIFIIQKFTTQINLYFNTNGSAMLGIYEGNIYILI